MVGNNYRKGKFVSLKHSLLVCKFFMFLAPVCCCFAKHTVEDIQLEHFNLAYTPWYTGSLLSLSARTTPEKVTEYQAYFTVNVNYGVYSHNFSVKRTPHEIVLNPLLIIYHGFTKWMDMQLNLETFTKFKQSKHSTHSGDQKFLLGFQALTQTHNLPYIRLAVQETFPTGKYQKLKKNNRATDQTGEGAFATTFGVFIQKLHDWFYYHPIRTRYNITYTIPSNVKVKGLNAYEGSETTDGTVKPGDTLYFLFSPEISITQKWVATFDLVYTHTFTGSFSGQKGFDDEGNEASINTKASDLVQLAPAIEYNFTSTFGVLGGLSFSVTGKNTESFLGGIVSVIGNF